MKSIMTEIPSEKGMMQYNRSAHPTPFRVHFAGSQSTAGPLTEQKDNWSVKILLA